ncbi:hypothetical protein DPM13_08875 [Paracoccus mutanolyticus]|uniref:Uncharacterized protein n=1 Tax=Paracoccus mutanolyticus TaxID=1499308 RepID=A0ABM6WRF8_9RHOB|nr:hypothetical protein DPM13_08875 [Paracoccus mutanolyticus]
MLPVGLERCCVAATKEWLDWRLSDILHHRITGHTRFGRLDDTLEDLIVAASREALHEANLSGDAIDAMHGFQAARSDAPHAPSERG